MTCFFFPVELEVVDPWGFCVVTVGDDDEEDDEGVEDDVLESLEASVVLVTAEGEEVTKLDQENISCKWLILKSF